MVRLSRRTSLTLVLAGLLNAACSTPDPIALDSAEVREYEGTRLSPANDFRENSIKGPQFVPKADYNLAVTGLVERPLLLTYAQVLDRQQYKKVVTLHCVEGWDATILWDGILVDELVKQAGAKPEAVIVIFHAADGYTSSLPLEYVRGNGIMLAHKMNEVTLPPERGFPFHLVAESKWGYKWVRWVDKIELSPDPNYRGYWESAGYSNKGDLTGSVFGPD